MANVTSGLIRLFRGHAQSVLQAAPRNAATATASIMTPHHTSFGVFDSQRRLLPARTPQNLTRF